MANNGCKKGREWKEWHEEEKKQSKREKPEQKATTIGGCRTLLRLLKNCNNDERAAAVAKVAENETVVRRPVQPSLMPSAPSSLFYFVLNQDRSPLATGADSNDLYERGNDGLLLRCSPSEMEDGKRGGPSHRL